jgi:hypothetical protein
MSEKYERGCEMDEKHENFSRTFRVFRGFPRFSE